MNTDETQAATTLVNWAIFSARIAFENACYWERLDQDITRQFMIEYHLHVKIAYALNEALNASVDVRGALLRIN
jgi:hypothetical protein